MHYLEIQRNNTDQTTYVTEFSYFLLIGFQKNNSIITSYVQSTVQDKFSLCFAKMLAHIKRKRMG